MAVFMKSPILIKKNWKNIGVDIAWSIITEGKSSKCLLFFLDHFNSGHGWGCEVHHGVTSDSMIPCSRAFRVSKYKYLRGCPAKYLPLVKDLEKALHS